MSDAIREAFEAWWASETDSGYPPTKMGDKYESALADYAWVGWQAAVKTALQSQTAHAVPEGWRTAKDGGHWPHIGGKYLIKLNGVLQHEIYEFDQADDGCGGGEYFWDRDDLDESAPFDPENDSWLPIDQAGVTTSAVPDATAAEELASALREIEGTVNRTATSDQFIRHLKQIATDALAAIPKPDHYPDAGKVVEEMETESPITFSLYCPECSELNEQVAFPLKTHQRQSCGHEWHPFIVATADTNLFATPAADGGEVEQLREELAEMKRLFGTAMEVADFPDAHPAQPHKDVQAQSLFDFANEIVAGHHPGMNEKHVPGVRAAAQFVANAKRLRSNGGDA